MLTGKRLLIVEPEALIAVDMQRIAEDAGAVGVTIVTPSDLPRCAELTASGEIDLVVYAPAGTPGARGEPPYPSLDAGVALVICTADPLLAIGYSQRAVVVSKPFRDSDFVDACAEALRRAVSSGSTS